MLCCFKATPEASCAEVLHARLHLLPLVDTVAYAALPQLVVVPCYREDPLDMLLGYNTPAEQLLDHAIHKVRLGI